MTAISREQASERRVRGRQLQREASSSSGPLRHCLVLGSFNLELIAPLLVEALDRAGVAARVGSGPFGQISEQALNPRSQLYAAAPDDVVLVPGAEDLLAAVFAGDCRDAAAQDELVDERLEQLEHAVGAVLERLPQSGCYVVTCGCAQVPDGHVLDPIAPPRGQHAVQRLLDGVRRLRDLSPRVVIVDWAWEAGPVHPDGYVDDRLWYAARMRLAPAGLASLADLAARQIAAQRNVPRKAIAVDLDDTLWGGIVGEVGLSGIVLGIEGSGLAFQDMQRELLKLRAGGVLLLACSKNDRAAALEVFERHPHMLLRLEHFAAERINWQDKATNLRELADELALGADSFVFIDDNPVEREWIRRALPDVLVPELPADPVARPRAIRALRCFDRLGLTEADGARNASYAAQRDRRGAQAASLSFEDFLRSLDQRVTIEPLEAETLARAAQLCQRTNQFNMTTRRYDHGDLEAILADVDAEAHTVAVSDRFGDSGITGLAILRFVADEAEIDTLLLSCRVLGRGIEDRLLSFLVDRARERGARRLLGRRIATQRNQQTADFYAQRGFAATGAGVHRINLGALGSGPRPAATAGRAVHTDA